MANIRVTHIFVKLVYIHIYILKKLYEWHVMCCYGYIETWSVLIITNEISAIILYIRLKIRSYTTTQTLPLANLKLKKTKHSTSEFYYNTGWTVFIKIKMIFKILFKYQGERTNGECTQGQCVLAGRTDPIPFSNRYFL
jgi:hypothetical protein